MALDRHAYIYGTGKHSGKKAKKDGGGWVPVTELEMKALADEAEQALRRAEESGSGSGAGDKRVFCGVCGTAVLVPENQSCLLCGASLAPEAASPVSTGSGTEEKPSGGDGQLNHAAIEGEKPPLDSVLVGVLTSVVLVPGLLLVLLDPNFREGGLWAVLGNLGASAVGWSVLGAAVLGALRLITKRTVFSQLLRGVGLWGVAGLTLMLLALLMGVYSQPESLPSSPTVVPREVPGQEEIVRASVSPTTIENCSAFADMEHTLAGADLAAYSAELRNVWADETDAQLVSRVETLRSSVSEVEKVARSGDAAAYIDAARSFYATYFDIVELCATRR